MPHLVPTTNKGPKQKKKKKEKTTAILKQYMKQSTKVQ
jgi:hypothetical protein